MSNCAAWPLWNVYFSNWGNLVAGILENNNGFVVGLIDMVSLEFVNARLSLAVL